MNTKELIESLLGAAAEAGAAIRKVAEGRVDVREKADASPVTEADERAERILLAALERLTPGVTVIAEEAASAGGVPAESEGPFWLVDPLDGTKEFLKGGSDFTVNLALVEGRRPVLGIVFCPADGRLFAGAAGQGAWRARLAPDGTVSARQAIRTRRAAEPLTIVASKSHGNPETEAYLGRYPGAELVSIGSSLKFCLVAEGAADLYPRLGPTMEWDTAAGHGVLLAAGGQVADETGAPFLYRKPGFRNGHFLAWGDPDFAPVPLSGISASAD